MIISRTSASLVNAYFKNGPKLYNLPPLSGIFYFFLFNLTNSKTHISTLTPSPRHFAKTPECGEIG
jgi:hypothetical protein